MKTLKQRTMLQRMTIMILLLLSVAIMASTEGIFAQEKFPSDIYIETNGMPEPFLSSQVVTYDGDNDLNNQLQLYKAATNSGNPIIYTSTDTNVAAINSKGYITAKQPGTTTIRMRASETDRYLEANASVELTIQKNARSIKGTTSYTKAVGNSNFDLSILADENGALQYESSNRSVATVSKEGNVTIKGPGTAVITATAMESTWYTSKALKINLVVKPGKAVLKGITSAKEKTLKVSWNKMSGISGYQAICATNSGFTSGKKVKTVSSKTSSVTFTGLLKGTKYYAKVRGYKTIQGKNYYGVYSKAKTVTVKGRGLHESYAGKHYYTKYVPYKGGAFIGVNFGKAYKGKIKLSLDAGTYHSGENTRTKSVTGIVQGRTIKFKIDRKIEAVEYEDGINLEVIPVNIRGTITLVNSKNIKIKIDSSDEVYYKYLKTGSQGSLRYYPKKPWLCVQ